MFHKIHMYIQLDKDLYKRINDGHVDQNQEALLSAKKIEGHIFARSRKDGDRFFPLGAPGNKKVSDWMIDRKWTETQKSETPLFINQKNEIVWIPGFPPAELYKITRDDKWVIRLTYKHSGCLSL